MGRQELRAIRFSSADASPLTLEGIVRFPSISGNRSVPGAVLCHPHPLNSDMNDPLLTAVAEGLVSHGIATLQFNFRGVGLSEGASSDGRREPLDLAGAVARLLEESVVDPGRLCIIGHAFGGVVALEYAAYDPRAQMVVAVSPPVTRLLAGTGAFERPRLIITGELDEVSPPRKLERWIESLPGGCALRVVAQGQHLLVEQARSTADGIVRFVERWSAMLAQV